MKQKVFYILYLISFVAFFFGGIEIYFNYLLNHPEKCPVIWKETLIKYYREHDSIYIQQEEEMAQFDSTLFYTLKPGNFVFKNREFSTPFRVNSIGCRDDESSLDSPKIVMLGDSYGMGWGIQQEKTYANLVESTLNIKTLNMGVSSFGTPREIEFLNSVNTDSLAYLIIQYCPNDYIEITEYVRNGNQLIVSNEEIYDSVCDVVKSNNTYYPLKVTHELLPVLINGEKEDNIRLQKKGIKKTHVNAVKGFLDVIRNSTKIPAHTKIFVFTLDEIGFNNYFLEHVTQTLSKEFSSSLHDQITFLDFSKTLTPENYFILDVHTNASAHQIIADTLVEYIQKSKKGLSEKKWYYENGSISINASYNDHYKEGVTTYYWSNGNVSMQTNYKRGLKNGEEIRYNESGKEIERKFYKENIAL